MVDEKQKPASFTGRLRSWQRYRDHQIEEGTLMNPKSTGGPIFGEMMKEVLETYEGKDKKTYFQGAEGMDEFLDTYTGNKVKKIYNEFLLDAYQNPPAGQRKNARHADYSHARFHADVHKYFWEGLALYMKVSLREDLKKAPETEGRHKVSLGGGKTMFISDDRSQPQINRQWLLRKASEDYGIPIGNDQIIPEKIQPPHEDAFDAYRMEKIKFFAVEFFGMLTESLKRGIPALDALALAEKTYGHGKTIYEEMSTKPHEFDDATIANICKSYPLGARERFDTYTEIWEDLFMRYAKPDQGELPAVNRELLTKSELRDYIFKYHKTITIGLELAEVSLDALRNEYPYIPASVIIKKCITNPNDVREQLQNIGNRAEQFLDSVICTKEIC